MCLADCFPVYDRWYVSALCNEMVWNVAVASSNQILEHDRFITADKKNRLREV